MAWHGSNIEQVFCGLDKAFPHARALYLSMMCMQQPLSENHCSRWLFRPDRNCPRTTPNLALTIDLFQHAAGSLDMGGRLYTTPLTTDHSPDTPSEASRVMAAGGVVRPFVTPNGMPAGPLRVWAPGRGFPGLRMTRAFGDLASAAIGILDTPEIAWRVVTRLDKCVPHNLCYLNFRIPAIAAAWAASFAGNGYNVRQAMHSSNGSSPRNGFFVLFIATTRSHSRPELQYESSTKCVHQLSPL